jgi:dipeptidyl aminopeptidase/acylaminoacyl peptidase
MLEKTARLPSALESRQRHERLGRSNIPVMLVHPDWDAEEQVPLVIWMHGRTASKELDPGRYLRLMRAGIGVCAVDLPGHGERFEAPLQHPAHTLDVILQMIDEIDEIVDAVTALGVFDRDRLGIGGMSAGGMATLSRLCRPHPFRCASVEATTGSWMHQQDREMFHGRRAEEIHPNNPMEHLEHWRQIPLQAIHSKLDSWVSFDGQAAFIEELRWHYGDPMLIELIAYEETGAPFEHAGFGRLAADAKEKQRNFFRKWLIEETGES